MSKTVLLDTSFLITCIKQKIDFLDEIALFGYQIIIPEQVINELKKKSRKNADAKVALKLIDKNLSKTIDLKTKNTDNGIIAYARANKNVVVATLDKEIQEKVRKKIIIRGKKRLEII